MKVTVPPAIVTVSGSGRLIYELHITNYSKQPFDLAALDVLDDGPGGVVVRHLDSQAIQGALANPGAPKGTPGTLGPGGHAMLYIDLDLPVDKPAPRALRHRLSVGFVKPDGTAVQRTLEGQAVPMTGTRALVLGAPLHGGEWLAFDVMSTSAGGHRRTTMVLDGQSAVAQRFAIDWVKLGKDGLAYTGNPASNSNWYGYGAEVVAVADGVVADVRDGLQDNAGNAGANGPVTADTIAGNYISLRLANGLYAFYAHLQPGRMRVKPGDRVRAGQVLGLLGNSGNSDAPHLHFHVTSGNSILGSEGVPYAFDQFDSVGIMDDAEAHLEHGTVWHPEPPTRPRLHQRELPANNNVVRFAGAGASTAPRTTAGR